MLAGDVTPEIRAQIFALAAQDVPRRQIAARLGISEGSVRYQLDRPARPAPDGAAGSSLPGLPAADLGLPGDPLAEARRAFQLEQLQTQQVGLRAQRLEAEKRLEMLNRAPAGDSGAILLVLRELEGLNRNLQGALAKPAPPAPPQPGLFDQLTQLRQGWEAVRTIGGEDKPPSTEAELGVRVALDRLNMEREERQRRLDFELEDRRRQQDNDRIRSEAIAQQIGQWGPMLAQGFQQWIAQQGAGGASRTPESAPDARAEGAAALAVLPGGSAVQPAAIGMAEGPCPSCGVPLRIRPNPAADDACPRCHMALAVVSGKIWPRLPSGPVQRTAG